MSRTAVHAISLAVLAAVGLGVAVVVSPGAPGLTAEIYLFVMAALVLAAVLLRVADALPRAEPVPLEQPPRSQRVGQLESVERALERAEASSFDLHNALRPIVLRDRRGPARAPRRVARAAARACPGTARSADVGARPPRS